MAIDATLTRVDKNRIFLLVEKSGIDPTEFRWDVEESQEAGAGYGSVSYQSSRLTHIPTGFYFKFGGMLVICSPGETRKVEAKIHGNDLIFKLGECREWLGRVKAESEIPDLWANIGRTRTFLDAASSASDNRFFSPAERGQIAVQLAELKQNLIEGQDFEVEQAALIEERFDYLKQSSERLGKKDWLNVALGAFVSLIIDLALDPEKSRHLLTLAGSLFHWVSTGSSLLN